MSTEVYYEILVDYIGKDQPDDWYVGFGRPYTYLPGTPVAENPFTGVLHKYSYTEGDYFGQSVGRITLDPSEYDADRANGPYMSPIEKGSYWIRQVLPDENLLDVPFTDSDQHPGEKNQSPVAEDDGLTLSFFDESDPFTVWDNDSDPDGDDISIIGFSDGAYGKLRLNDDGTFVYVPDGFFSGYDYFQYEISDEDGLTDEAEVELYVLQENANGTPAGLFGDMFGDLYFERNEFFDDTPATQPYGPSSLEVSTPQFQIDTNGDWQVSEDYDLPSGADVPSGSGGKKGLLREILDNPMDLMVDMLSRYYGKAGKSISEVYNAGQKLKELVDVREFFENRANDIRDVISGEITIDEFDRLNDTNGAEYREYIESREEFLQGEGVQIGLDTFSTTIHNSDVFVSLAIGNDTKTYGAHREEYFGGFGDDIVRLGGNDDLERV